MEGIGTRFGRLTSRYGAISGPGPSPPVFHGPVRKWKRKWVRSSQPNGSAVKGSKGRHHEDNPSLLLWRWTPLNPAAGDPPEPTKRKFRYTPVVVLEQKENESLKKINPEAEARKMKQPDRPLTLTNEFESLRADDDDVDDFEEEMEEAEEDDNDEEAYSEDLDLQLRLKKPYRRY